MTSTTCTTSALFHSRNDSACKHEISADCDQKIYMNQTTIEINRVIKLNAQMRLPHARCWNSSNKCIWNFWHVDSLSSTFNLQPFALCTLRRLSGRKSWYSHIASHECVAALHFSLFQHVRANELLCEKKCMWGQKVRSPRSFEISSIYRTCRKKIILSSFAFSGLYLVYAITLENSLWRERCVE